MHRFSLLLFFLTEFLFLNFICTSVVAVVPVSDVSSKILCELIIERISYSS